MDQSPTMRRAIALAVATRPHPNPRVGAVVVDRDGRILAEGAHRGPGHPHAEREALDALADVTAGDTTLVVTLEPCDHHARTPPCTERILESGIGRVVVGTLDPDPRVSGRGIRRLQEAGVEVVTGILADEIEAADPAYFHHRRRGRSRITLKRAMTLDGQTAARDGSSRWITGPEAREDVHRLRAEADAVLVGAGTLRMDDPALTARSTGYRGPQPTPVVVAGEGSLPADARIWEREDALVVATRRLDVPARVLVVDKGDDGLPDMSQVVVRLGEHGLLDVLVEGGARISAALWNSGLVDRGIFYFGSRIAGGGGVPVISGTWETFEEGRALEMIQVDRVGDDIRVEWRPVPQ